MAENDMETMLKELKEVDDDLWQEIQDGVTFGQDLDECRLTYEGMSAKMALDHIQGGIQRAIATKEGWNYKQGLRRTDGMYWAIVDIPGCPGKRIFADTPAAAILAAYIETVRAMR